VTTGIILQELLQGFSGPGIAGKSSTGSMRSPYWCRTGADHVDAVELRNTCRRRALQIGTIDALLAQLCLRYDPHDGDGATETFALFPATAP